MTNIAENAEQEVSFTNQAVGSYLGNGASQSKTDENFHPLVFLVRIHTPKMAKKAEQEVGFAKQGVGSYLENSASLSKTDKNSGLLGYIYIHTAYICQIWPKNPKRKLVRQTGNWVVSRKLCIIEQKRTKIWTLWAT